MKNKQYILYFLLFFILQVLLFKKINLFGYINPLPYLFFVLLFPADGNKYTLLISSFLLGLLLDVFEDSGGINSLALLGLVALKPRLLQLAFGVSYEYKKLTFSKLFSRETTIYFISGIVVHHFIFFSLALFQVNLILVILQRTLLTAVFTYITSVLMLYLIKPTKI